ncbi:hypothetical protein PIB30_072614 [Stylosanthes scabra]|uniref:Uncharacterized protein n=1 Tax=Stylosanthes scabra TaxID=79078 RepID=A0ABU6WNR0_9FABA|nr:hypothetical protein [Stylosanthes scabra]
MVPYEQMSSRQHRSNPYHPFGKSGERKLEEQERRNLEHSARAPMPRREAWRLTPRRPEQQPRVKPSTPRRPKSSSRPSHPRLGVAQQASSTSRLLKANA